MIRNFLLKTIFVAIPIRAVGLKGSLNDTSLAYGCFILLESNCIVLMQGRLYGGFQ